MQSPIKNYMTEQPHSIRMGETLIHAKQLMTKLNIRHLPVLEGREVVGLISDRDFSLVDLYPDLNLEHSTVEDIMFQDVYQVAPDTPLSEVVKDMSVRKLGSAIVVDHGTLVGIFTSVDALILLSKIYDAPEIG